MTRHMSRMGSAYMFSWLKFCLFWCPFTYRIDNLKITRPTSLTLQMLLVSIFMSKVISVLNALLVN